MYDQLTRIDHTPAPFEIYTAEKLWNDDHISAQMLAFHLNPDMEPASRNHEFMAASQGWMADKFDIRPGMAVADLGCGPGFYTTAFARKGAEVTGIDFSRRSIGYAMDSAAREGLDITYIQDNYLNWSPKQTYDLITLIYCDYCPLSPDQRSQLMGKIWDTLKPGGIFLLDVCSLKAFEKVRPHMQFSRNLMDGFWSARDYFGFQKTVRYEAEQVGLNKYTIITKEEQFEIYNWLQYFSLESLSEELTQNGFTVAEVFSDVAGRAYDKESDTLAVIAVKG